jgi:hypothetical protein
MVWQVIDDVRWRLAGAYGHTPTSRGTADLGHHPRLTTALFDRCWATGTHPPISASMAAVIRRDLIAWRIDTVVLSHRSGAAAGQACAAGVIARALDAQPRPRTGVLVFLHVRGDLARRALADSGLR